MKITDIKTYIMDAYRTNWTFVKVETDEGIYGGVKHLSEHRKWHLPAVLKI